MEEFRIEQEDADLTLTKAWNGDVLLELVIEDGDGLEVLLTKKDIKSLIKQLTDMLSIRKGAIFLFKKIFL